MECEDPGVHWNACGEVAKVVPSTTTPKPAGLVATVIVWVGCGWVIPTVAPVVVTGVIPTPAESEANPADSEIAVEVSSVDGEMVTCAVATTPFAMVVVFSPNTMQFRDPETGLQVTDLPALVAAAPATTVIDAMSIA